MAAVAVATSGAVDDVRIVIVMMMNLMLMDDPVQGDFILVIFASVANSCTPFHLPCLSVFCIFNCFLYTKNEINQVCAIQGCLMIIVFYFYIKYKV